MRPLPYYDLRVRQNLMEKRWMITEGEFIQAGSQVEVIKVEGFKIIVEKVEDHS